MAIRLVVERLRPYYAAQPDAKCKTLVAHHPFIPPGSDATAALVGGAPAALRMLEAHGSLPARAAQ